MAQQIALRIWSDRRGCPNGAFHPTCHLEIHEQKGYQLLHGLHGVLVGQAMRIITLADLEKVSEPLAVLLLELPQREIGGWLPKRIGPASAEFLSTWTAPDCGSPARSTTVRTQRSPACSIRCTFPFIRGWPA